MASDTLIGAK